MKKKVLHLIDNFARGGAPLVVKNIVDRIDRIEFESSICPLRPIVELDVDVPIIKLPYRNYDPRKVLAIARFCRNNNIDIIHGHLSKGNICSLLAGFLCKSKVILHEHGEIFCRGRYAIYQWILRCCSGRASRIVAVSEATKKKLADVCKLSGDKITVVSNFVNFDVFDLSKYNREEIRQKLNFKEEDIVIGFVGRLDRSKGVDIFLDTASVLCRQNTMFRFIVVGDGHERGSLENQARSLAILDKVVFAGMVKNPAPLIRAFDVGVVPSRREAFGMAAIELMAMNIPVVAADVGGLKELVINEQTGLICAKSTGSDFAAAIRRIAADTSLRTKVIQNASVLVQKYSIDIFINSVEKLYRDVEGQIEMV